MPVLCGSRAHEQRIFKPGFWWRADTLFLILVAKRVAVVFTGNTQTVLMQFQLNMESRTNIHIGGHGNLPFVMIANNKM